MDCCFPIVVVVVVIITINTASRVLEQEYSSHYSDCYELDDPGFNSRQGQEVFLLFRVHPASNWKTEAVTPGVERLVRACDH